MRYELQVRVWMSDSQNLWQQYCGNHINLTESSDVGTRGHQPMPGLSFDTDMVEHLFAPWVGNNTYGEAIFLAINESNERHGCFFVDSSMMDERLDHNPHKQPLTIEWEVVKISDAVATEECVALEGPWLDRSELFDEDQYTLEKTFQRSNDRWRLTRKHPDEPDDVLALCQTERLVDMLIAMLSDPMIVISRRFGEIQDVMCPYHFLPSVNFLIVDWDSQDTENTNYVTTNSEDGDGLAAVVHQPDLCHPTGAGTVDRIVAAFLDQ